MKHEVKVVRIGRLRVVLVKDTRQSITVKAVLGSGSREENDIEAGSAHFLEHFVFKGTRDFPKPMMINEAVENVGGVFNAYTGQDQMGFWVKMAKDNLELAMKIVGQVVCCPIFPDEEFDKEKGTILEELHMYEDRPDAKVAQECVRLLMGETNLGRPIVGTKKSLKNMKLVQLKEYWKKWFVAENLIVGVVGNFESAEEVLELVKKEFGKIVDEDKAVSKVRDVFVWPQENKYQEMLVTRKMDQVQVMMGFPGLKVTDKRWYVLELLNLILGDAWMSRLLKEVREGRGWAYAIGSGVESYVDSGMVLIGAGLPKGKLNEAVSLVWEIASGLVKGGKWEITKKDLEFAKSCMKGRLALKLDKPENVLGDAMDDLLYKGTIESVEEVLEGLDKVSLEDVWKLAGELFVREKMKIAVVGPYKKLELGI